MTKAEKWGHSIISYPERGEGGSSSWRGNCNSTLIQEVMLNFKPKHVKKLEDMRVLEVFAGSGTGDHACETLGIKNHTHLDLNPIWGGWNALKDEIPSGADFVFSHPPYHDMVVYSGEMWGESHPDDLSRCASYDEFIHKLNIVNAKIYNSLRNGGKHAMLIGDMRKKGTYFSMIKDLVWYGDLEAHIIKEQFNTVSQRKKYANMNFVPIMHEHLLVFKKNDVWHVAVKITKTEKRNLLQSKLVTWRDLVQSALQSLGGKANLNDIYQVVAKADKTKANSNWEAKIRQTLQMGKEFASEARGVWKLSEGYELQTA
jgi:hypothetical protein